MAKRSDRTFLIWQVWPEFSRALLKTVCPRGHAEKAGLAVPDDDADATYTCGFALVRFTAEAHADAPADADAPDAPSSSIAERASATVANVLQHDSLTALWSAEAEKLPYMRHAVVTPAERERLLGAEHAAAP